jgi:hypothetical protein
VVQLKQRANAAATALVLLVIYGASAWRALQLLSPTTRMRIVSWLLLVTRVVVYWVALVVVFTIPVVTVVALYEILSSVEVDVYDLLLAID